MDEDVKAPLAFVREEEVAAGSVSPVPSTLPVVADAERGKDEPEGEEAGSMRRSSSSKDDPARREETCDRRAGIILLREVRCIAGVEFEAARSADRLRSMPDAEAELEETGLLESDEDGSILAESGRERDADGSVGVRGAEGGGELGGEDNSMSTSATSCASFIFELSLGIDSAEVADCATSDMTTSCSWSDVAALCESASSLGAWSCGTFGADDLDSVQVFDEDPAKSEAKRPAAMTSVRCFASCGGEVSVGSCESVARFARRARVRSR